jgi:hypothetical protein
MDTKLDIKGTGPFETPAIVDYLGLAYSHVVDYFSQLFPGE